jgi:hypothetical protein
MSTKEDSIRIGRLLEKAREYREKARLRNEELLADEAVPQPRKSYKEDIRDALDTAAACRKQAETAPPEIVDNLLMKVRIYDKDVKRFEEIEQDNQANPFDDQQVGDLLWQARSFESEADYIRRTSEYEEEKRKFEDKQKDTIYKHVYSADISKVVELLAQSHTWKFEAFMLVLANKTDPEQARYIFVKTLANGLLSYNYETGDLSP